MADSANILSILSMLGQGDQPEAPTNVLQAVQPPEAAPIPVAAPPQAQPALTIAPPEVPAEAEHPRKRRSVIDTIGRLADVFAKVGGADALYQPTLDSREDRELALGDHARTVDLDALRKSLLQQQVTAGDLEPAIAARKRLGTALGALANNPEAATLWPSVAEQAGITDPQQVAAIGAQLQRNPGSAGIFAKALGADIDNLGKNVYFGTDGQGKTVAYQVGPDGNPHILDFSAAGVTPSDPIKVVNTGGSSVIVGSGGQTKRILPNSEAPGKREDRVARVGMNDANNRTRITIAGMPARSQGGGNKGGDSNSDVSAILRDFGIKLTGKQDPVADLINESTSGYAESLTAKAVGAFGRATPGMEKIGRLQTIDNALVLALAGGKLGAGVSNADRDFFKEMSGKISDPNIPANQRIAAWNQIKTRLRGIQQSAAKPAAKPAGNSGGWGKATVVR